jgi:hypothetical protein
VTMVFVRPFSAFARGEPDPAVGYGSDGADVDSVCADRLNVQGDLSVIMFPPWLQFPGPSGSRPVDHASCASLSPENCHLV